MENTLQLIEELKKEFSENRNSHIFLFETNNVANCTRDIKSIIKYVLNADNITANQIDNENYIELVIVRPDGKEIKKDQIASLQERLKSKPVLGNYIFYIIENAEKMNDISANKLLKTIEEPNENVVGFMVSETIASILPTIRSRAEIHSLVYEKADVLIDNLEEIDNYAVKIIELMETDSLLNFNLFKDGSKKVKDYLKENGKIVANRIKDYYNTACRVQIVSNINEKTVKLIQKSNKFKELVAKTKYLNETLNKLVVNMNTDLLLEKIFIELKEVKSNANSRD